MLYVGAAAVRVIAVFGSLDAPLCTLIMLANQLALVGAFLRFVRISEEE